MLTFKKWLFKPILKR